MTCAGASKRLVDAWGLCHGPRQNLRIPRRHTSIELVLGIAQEQGKEFGGGVLDKCGTLRKSNQRDRARAARREHVLGDAVEDGCKDLKLVKDDT
ncbi:MAG: hypothetical protein HY791_31655 [Deltaproteobacteria bacterium]|nr:hypothetical protein [Deltaproteobacteria bacterium]